MKPEPLPEPIAITATLPGGDTVRQLALGSPLVLLFLRHPG